MSDGLNPYHNNIRSDVFHIIPSPAGRVLDLGGGYGATGAELKKVRNADFVVVADLVAREVSNGVDATVTGDVEGSSLLNSAMQQYGPFDTILCLDILEHLKDPWSIVGELHKSLKEGGVIIASIPNVNHWSLVFPLVFRGRFDLQDGGIRDRTHLRWFTRESAIHLMNHSGLTVEHVEGIIEGKKGLLNRLTFGVLARFMVVQYYIRARKI